MADTPLLTRRTFLATGAAITAGAVVPRAILSSLSNTTDVLEVTEHRLSLRGLPSAFEGYRIAQVSDVHLYDGYHPASVQTLAALEKARPDLIVVTGDMWDTTAGIDAAANWLREMPAGVPRVAILGNHEYAHLPAGIRPESAYEKAGIPLLVNESLVLEHRGARMALVGLDDLRHGAPDPVRAAQAVPEGVVECWLIHEPGTLGRMIWPEWDAVRFTLLGHTHGGQIRIPGIPAVRPSGSGGYLAGRYDVAGTPAYVSRGIGTSGPRLRVACPAELPVFTLAAS
jgi:predicted MPP superfamily phosphohydrolase